MPTYDYRCTRCGQQIEVMHSIHQPGPETCTACGGAMRKALSTPAIHFKGSGWAKKDAATSASKAASAGGAAASPATSEQAKDGAAADKGKAAVSDTGATASSDTGQAKAGGQSPRPKAD
jgi:putative FmdB family regulatory protein